MRRSQTLQHRTSLTRPRTRWWLLVCALAVQASLAEPDPESRQQVAESQLPPATVVMGIVAYTRWPEPARGLSLCITRTASDAAALVSAVEALPAGRPLSWRHVEADAELPTDCDLVYFEGWDSEAQRRALRGLAGQPVLSIGWGREFCSDGGLFCLESAAAQTLFASNLDAVARSGLRINAQVLRLSLPRKAAGT